MPPDVPPPHRSGLRLCPIRGARRAAITFTPFGRTAAFLFIPESRPRQTSREMDREAAHKPRAVIASVAASAAPCSPQSADVLLLVRKEAKVIPHAAVRRAVHASPSGEIAVFPP